MLTLITGTPGAGKSLHAVWEFARKVPGSTVENQGEAVPRRLLSNVKDLLVEHERIEAAELENWHTWAKPGDVILFDEVQEVWRPRGLGSKVPECIAALETHRHMGVDIILITQHPMLVDPNIRRLVNQHLHLRRITRTCAMVYEWDHCANPGMVKTCVSSRVWWHPKKAYSLYKSAQLHTKTTARMPKVLWLGVAALAGLAYAGPYAWNRISGSFGAGKPEATAKAPATPEPAFGQLQGPGPLASAAPPEAGASAPEAAAFGASPSQGAKPARAYAGCSIFRGQCACYDDEARRVKVEPEICAAETTFSQVKKEDYQAAAMVDARGYALPPAAPTQAELDAMAWMARSGGEPAPSKTSRGPMQGG